MRKFLFFVLFLFAAQTASAQVVESILKHKDFFNRKDVSIEGELIGDIIQKKGRVLVNLKDGNFFIGLILPGELAKKVKYTRLYKTEGDIIKAEGIFYSEHPEFFGESLIQVTSLETVKFGGPVEKKENWVKIRVLIYLVTSALVLAAVYAMTRVRYGRKNP